MKQEDKVYKAGEQIKQGDLVYLDDKGSIHKVLGKRTYCECWKPKKIWRDASICCERCGEVIDKGNLQRVSPFTHTVSLT